MPWRERSVVDERREFVKLAMLAGANKSELCRRFGISRSKGDKWLKRYQREGEKGLVDRSRRPHRSPLRSSQLSEAEVLRIRDGSNNAWGGRKIWKVMEDEGWPEVPCPSTITAILRRHNRLETNRAEHPGPFKRFERAHPNELWQMDYKGHFALLQGRCHPLTVLDDHSRYSLGLEACADEQDPTVRQRITKIFRRYGLPLAMIMDNGSPWGGDDRFNGFEVWLMRLGIRVAHGRPYHPQTQGKDERFHRSLKAEMLKGKSYCDIEACQRAFDDWRHIYNHKRPHDALGLETPSTRYRPSPRTFPEQLPAIAYGPGDQVRTVSIDGFISFRGRPFRIARGLRRQPVALRQATQDGLYEVHFCGQQIAMIDLRDNTVRACGFVDAADNPSADQAPPAAPTTPQAQHQNKDFEIGKERAEL